MLFISNFMLDLLNKLYDYEKFIDYYSYTPPDPCYSHYLIGQFPDITSISRNSISDYLTGCNRISNFYCD
jgi:hypothetical protein